MPLKLDPRLTPKKLLPKLERFFDLSGRKILAIEKSWKPSDGTPVFTVKGRYTTRGWTEWTQGFQFGSAILQFDATDDRQFLDIGRRKTVELMASHVSHIGVHDHGFNNVSTYGNLLRLMQEGRIPANDAERDFYELALKVSGAVQASRWTRLADGTGFIHSFNGAHSLFVDTIRSCRALAVAHLLGHSLMGEQDEKVSLLQRFVEHALNTARYSVYYGRGRDAYDVRGRTTHEAVFNPKNGVFRCPNSQQGYSPFSTWTRGLAWAICGFAEELELLEHHSRRLAKDLKAMGLNLVMVRREFLEAATATADFYLANSCADGIPMWDTGAPNLHRLPADYLKRRSNPFNRWEPVDSSAAAIAAQGLIRLGDYLASTKGNATQARRYRQAGLAIADTLFSEPYLSADPKHQGLTLHSVYHRPNGWDYVPPGQKVPCGESSMWGDYHARELALLILREAQGRPPLAFFAGI
ncbi:MAG: glycoside hydrolase family 88 protein [Verrucomicrobiales bacterium]|nr:glycoside hydrolase family 88 protein [Verrucomicrobiales bacterium]